MNPYASPQHSEPQDGASPQFEIIAPASDLKSILLGFGSFLPIALTMGLIFLLISCLEMGDNFLIVLLPSAYLTIIFSLLKKIRVDRRKRELFERPEATSGSTLYGGYFALGIFRGWQGYLFLTAEEAVIEIRQRFFLWPGTFRQCRLPLAEMEQALSRGVITLPVSPIPLSPIVDQPEKWLQAIRDLEEKQRAG